jgi:putative heme-binding domain-containing protein
LFAAITDPSREISPAFQATLIATAGGRVYHGVVIYDSPEGILVQTGPDTTVRITDTDGLVRRPSRQSLMPNGLLNQLSDQDLADLYAYLKTLAKPAAKPESKTGS